MGRYTVERLMGPASEVFLDTRVKTMENGHVVLDDGTEFDTDHHRLDRRGQSRTRLLAAHRSAA